MSHAETDACGVLIDAALPLLMHGKRPSGHACSALARPNNDVPIQNASSSNSIDPIVAFDKQNETSGKPPPNNSIS